MKKPQLSILVILTLLFLGFTAGFFLGRQQSSPPVTVSVPEQMHTVPPTQPTVETQPTEVITFPIHLNTAGKEELMALPGIGEVLAERILAYRDAAGRFETEYDLMNVEGIGEKRMEELLDLITTGG